MINKVTNMNINKEYNQSKLTLTVEGRIDTITSQELDDEIQKEINNFDYLIIDFTNVEYISSAGLRVLIGTQKKLRPKNIPFVIRNVNNNVGEIFRVSGFNQLLTIE